MVSRAPLACFVSALLVACGSPSGGGGTPTAQIAPPTGTPPTSGPAGPDGDGDGAVESVDCDDLDPASAPGKVEIACDGRDNDCAGGDDRAGCDHAFESASLVLTGFDGINTGEVAASPDLTGDGVSDLVVMGHTGVEWAALGFSLASATPGVPAFTLVSSTFPTDSEYPGDLTGDGHADVLTRDGLVAGPLVGRIDATVTPFTRAATLSYLASQAIDSNDDGELELVQWHDGAVSWYPPPFDVPSPWGTCAGPVVDFDDTKQNLLQRADLDGDGSLDLIGGTVHRAAGNPWEGVDRMDVWVILGQAQSVDGWCTWGWNLYRSGANDFDFADFDGDGIADVAGLTAQGIEVAYGPFPVSGESDLAAIADLVLEGAESSEAHVVPDATGDGLPDLLYTCVDRVVVASLAAPGRVRNACEAGRTFLVTQETASEFGGHMFRDLVAGGDYDGDGSTDVAVFDKAGGGARVWLGAGL